MLEKTFGRSWTRTSESITLWLAVLCAASWILVMNTKIRVLVCVKESLRILTVELEGKMTVKAEEGAIGQMSGKLGRFSFTRKGRV